MTPRRLRPRLCPRPRILFVGINPSLRSAAVGHPFAGPGNPFWRLRHAAALVPDPLTYAVYRAFVGPRAGGGAGPKPERIGTARVFVVSNPSGHNAAYPGFHDKLVGFRRLRRFADAP
jgi:G:T/U-mismatch repair DNA glycosylase